MAKPRLCPKPGCIQPLKRSHLVCGRHWHELPDLIKAKIVRHLTSGNRDSARIVLGDYYTGGAQ
jgi:hypothetical protein